MDSNGSQSMERLHYKSSSSDNKLSLIFSIFAVITAVIGVIIAAVGLAHSGESNITVNGLGVSSMSGAQSGGNVQDDKIWMMGIGHGASRTEYLDEASGEIKGFNIDIVNAVCKIAGKNCQMVADIYTNCWDSQAGQSQRGGVGLMAGYYDACAAWMHSYVRHRTFLFSDSFDANPNDVVFIIKEGTAANFNHRDISGKVIGFIDGWVIDEFCVARDSNIGGTPILPEYIRHLNDRDEMLAAILDGSIDAGFELNSYWKDIEGVELVDEHRTNCAIAGRSMMMRKDSTMNDWWNPALAMLIKSPEYQLICKDLLQQHGHRPGPTPEELCINYRP